MVVLSWWSSVCRDLGDGGPRSGVIDNVLVGVERCDEGLDGEVVHRPGQAAASLRQANGLWPSMSALLSSRSSSSE